MTKARCLSAKTMAAIANGTGAGERELRHLDGCAVCTRRLALLRRVAAASVEKIAQSLDEVEALVGTLLSAPRSTWWRVVRQHEYLREDVVRRLLRLSLDARLRDRPLAIEFVRAATFIADDLPEPAEEVTTLRFDAWKLSSIVFRESSRFAEAEAALERAEAIIGSMRDSELALATLQISRALFLAEPDVWRPEEAADLLDRAESVIALRDSGKMYAVLATRAMLFFRWGASSEAREIFQHLVTFTGDGDREVYLDALSNLTWVRIEAEETSEDVQHAVSLLLHENTLRGRAAQVARATWMRGRLEMLLGRHDAALAALREAMKSVDNPDESIRIGIDIIRCHVVADRHDAAFELARYLATRAAELDAREPSRRRALTGEVMTYLRDAARRRLLTVDLIAYVAKYIDRIMRQRPMVFVPPMPLAEM
jgi:tetratricopeptide (TPR) repeat protein